MKTIALLFGLFAFSVAHGQSEMEAKWKQYGLYQPDVQLNLGGYKITKLKLAGLGLVALGGAANGMLQGYEFDGRASFERKWGKSQTGFWGSLSWTKRYRDGNPAYGLAHPAYVVLPVADFYHVTQVVHHHSLVTGGVLVGIGGGFSRQKWWHYLIDIGLSAAVNSTAQAAGLWWIRN